MNVTSTLSFAFKRYRHSMAVVLLLSLLASAMGIGVLAYLNTRLLQADAGLEHGANLCGKDFWMVKGKAHATPA